MSQTALPNHVGFILDGNRRWAKQNGLPTLEGHKKGSEVFKDITFDAFEKGVKYVSAFVFSTENWSRTKEEVKYLMSLVIKATEKYFDDYNEKGIRVVILGKRDGLDSKVQKSIKKMEDGTRNNTNGTLALCFNYGGQDEIIEATKKIVNSGASADEVTAELFTQSLYCPEIPELDLVIRTSGEQRISGFMLYRAAYSELLFTDTFWPDYTTQELDEHLLEFANRQRRFGG